MSTAHILVGLLDFRRLDVLACGDSSLHRLDARAKVVVTGVFIACVMSFDRYAISALMPFFVFPLAVVASSGLPMGYLLRKVALVLPIALLIGLPNLWFDRAAMLQFGGVTLTGGEVSLASIVLRSLLATAAAVLLVAVTGFTALCAALERLGMPRALAIQLLFLYRYLVVLGEEALRMSVAHEQRSDGRALSIRQYGSFVGRLLLRTWDRAERIYLAMCARGFTGDFRSGESSRIGRREILYVIGWSAVFLLLRTQDVARLLGDLTLGMLR
jgi:cobalt/nickel transport system permease protein